MNENSKPAEEAEKEKAAVKTEKARRRERTFKNLRALCEGAIMVAMAMILSLITLYKFPNGGSIDMAMVPIFFFALRWGCPRGLLVGLVFGALQLLYEGQVAWGWQSLLLDYLVAFTPLGLAGLFRGKGRGIFAGVLLGCLARFCVHYISGITIYAITMPTEIFSMTIASPAVFSLLYNGSYMLADTVICLLVFAALYKPMYKYIQAQDLA